MSYEKVISIFLYLHVFEQQFGNLLTYYSEISNKRGSANQRGVETFFFHFCTKKAPAYS